MRNWTFTPAIGTVLLLFAGSFASAAFVEQMAGGDGIALASGSDVLYSQLDDPSGYVFTDQEFEAVYAAYSSEGADDFYVGDAFGWGLTTIATPGLQTAGGTPFFTNHFFYTDAGGAPGAVIDGCDFPANTNFVHDLGDLLTTIDGCEVDAGTNWFSQSVRQDFVPFAQHFWATRLSANGNESVWRNVGNGFGNNCIDWQPANAVCGMNGADFQFELAGTFRGVCCGPPVPAIGPLGAVAVVLALAGASAVVLRRRSGG